MDKRYLNGVAGTLVILLLVPCLYLGGYYALLRPERRSEDGAFHPQYARTGELVVRLLLPAHWVDRRIRPSYWDYGYGDLDKIGGGPCEIEEPDLEVNSLAEEENALQSR